MMKLCKKCDEMSRDTQYLGIETINNIPCKHYFSECGNCGNRFFIAVSCKDGTFININPKTNTSDSRQQKIGCSGCGKWLQKGEKYGDSIDCLGISWRGCEQCCKNNNVIADREVQ